MPKHTEIALLVVVVAAACRGPGTPFPEQSLFSHWLLIDEPVARAFSLGTMWDGTNPNKNCFRVDSTVEDSTGRERWDTHDGSSDAGLGIEILKRIGLGFASHRAWHWSLKAWGTHVMIGYNITPTPGSNCPALREGLPRYPVIASMIGFDSLTFSGREVSGDSLKLTKADISSVINVTGGRVAGRDSQTFNFDQRKLLWVGYRLWALVPKHPRRCTWHLPLRVRGTCPSEDFPQVVQVSGLGTGDYEVKVQDPRRQPLREEIRKVGEGLFVEFGAPTDSSTAVGQWYELKVAPSDHPADVIVEIVERDYAVERFLSEVDRKKLDRFLAR
jgi:hypothetical protein